MFTGIIQEVGKLLSITQGGKPPGRYPCAENLPGIQTGRQHLYQWSLSDNFPDDRYHFPCGFIQRDPAAQHLQRRPNWRCSEQEPALRPIDSLGGHIVSGHVDGVGSILSLLEQGEFWDLVIEFPEALAPYIAEKGSLCVDGISLTLSRLEQNRASFALVPFTLENTNLRFRKPGDRVNLEVDLLARYIERLLHQNQPDQPASLTLEKLREYGFMND